MKVNCIFLIMILLSIMFNYEATNLKIKLKSNQVTISSNSASTKSKASPSSLSTNTLSTNSNTKNTPSSASSAPTNSSSTSSASTKSNASPSSLSTNTLAKNSTTTNTPSSASSAPTNSSSTSSASTGSSSNTSKGLSSNTSTGSSSNTSKGLSSNTSTGLSSNKTNASTTDDALAICNEANDYKILILEVEQSLNELMESFKDHLKILGNFTNSSIDMEDKLHWKERVRFTLDYYINKTASLLDIYTDLNNTINEISRSYCDKSKVVIVPVVPANSSEVKKPSDVNKTANTSILPALPTNSSEKKIPSDIKNTTNTLTKEVIDNRTTNTTQINSTIQVINVPNQRQSSSTNNIKNTSKVNSESNHKSSKKDVTTVFIQVLQDAATLSGLPDNYVQTRLKEIRDSKRKMKNSRKLK